MPGTTSKGRFSVGARYGLLLVPWVLGAALVVTAWLSRERIEEASELIVRGQAEYFWQSARQLVRREPGVRVSSDDLAAFLDSEREGGLRYVGIFEGRGRRLEAGEAAAPVGPPGREDMGARRVGARYRLTAPLPVGRRWHRPPRPPWSTDPRPRRHWPRAAVVLEFEPRVADTLRADAARDFAFSGAAAALLAVTSLFLWKLLRQRENEHERQERERRLAMLGEMSAVMAHEMRNPLASLKGHAQLLLEQLGADDDKARRKAERVVGEAERLELLSRSLLDFVRAGSVERRAVSPAEIAERAAESLDRSRIHVDASEAPPTWRLDELRFGQVLTNLLDNALRASPEGKNVGIRIVKDHGSLTVTVRDFGPGLPDGDAARLFDAFVTTRTRGTGLGLAIARRIVEMHDGSLDARNHPDGGAEFTVRIPQ